MNPEIKLRIKRAEEALKSAEINLENNLFADSVSRSYYAVYNALIGLLIHNNLSLPKTHSGLVAICWEHRRSLNLSEEDVKTLHRLLQLREESDYSPMSFLDRETAEEMFAFAENIVQKVKEIVGR